MNDIQKMLNAFTAVAAAGRSQYHLTLGQYIKALESAGPTALVRFDIGGHPHNPHSYRGYYSDLSLESSVSDVTVSAALEDAKAALGQTFEGYKGGDYIMTESTPLWTAPYGSCGRAIVGIEIGERVVTLQTKLTDEA